MTFRPRASPLHAARAAVAIGWCAALVVAALTQSNPIVLGTVAVAVLAAGAGAGVGRELRRWLRLAIPLALTIIVINALVAREGLTVIWRFGNLPILGQTDVTLEATVAGAVLGLRAATLVLIGALYSLTVDPDRVLALMRRWSFRSALSATIATRMVPVLLRDSRRLADAQRCRPGPPPGRVTLLRATTAGVLDRALDVAATLEVRGYATARRPPPAGVGRAPWSRHDLAFAAAAAVIAGLAVLARVAGWASFQAYPTLSVPAGPRAWGLAAALLAVTLVPFADRRGIAP
jgi:energy-coupling factor transport system permease protein